MYSVACAQSAFTRHESKSAGASVVARASLQTLVVWNSKRVSLSIASGKQAPGGRLHSAATLARKLCDPGEAKAQIAAAVGSEIPGQSSGSSVSFSRRAARPSTR